MVSRQIMNPSFEREPPMEAKNNNEEKKKRREEKNYSSARKSGWKGKTGRVRYGDISQGAENDI